MSVNLAIKQIKDKNYPNALKDYTGKILLIGIAYNTNDKNHTCIIEEFNNN